MPEKSTRESDPTPPRPSGPSDSQLETAIEGARDMDPPSRTGGGRLAPEGDPHGIEPDEAIKRSTGIRTND